MEAEPRQRHALWQKRRRCGGRRDNGEDDRDERTVDTQQRDWLTFEATAPDIDAIAEVAQWLKVRVAPLDRRLGSFV